MWLAVIVLAAVAVARVRRETIAPDATAVSPGVPLVFGGHGADTLARTVNRIIARDVFRLQRKPADVAYRPGLEGVPATPPVPPPPKPVLALAGITGGPPWEALLDGLPGSDHTQLAHAGSTFGALRVTRVTRDTVVVTGMDTVWTLTLKKTWP